jgi:hypothetical protein
MPDEGDLLRRVYGPVQRLSREILQNGRVLRSTPAKLDQANDQFTMMDAKFAQMLEQLISQEPSV